MNLLLVEGNLWWVFKKDTFAPWSCFISFLCPFPEYISHLSRCCLGTSIAVLDPATSKLKKRGSIASNLTRSSSVANFGDRSGDGDGRMVRAVSTTLLADMGDDIVLKTAAGHYIINGFPGEVCAVFTSFSIFIIRVYADIFIGMELFK